MSNYIEIKNQILKLQKQAETILKRERSEIISKIREAIGAYELTAEDLGLSVVTPIRRGQKAGARSAGASSVSGVKRRGRRIKKAAIKIGQRKRKAGQKSEHKLTSTDKRSVVAPKFRDATTGATWTGRGKQPKWLAAAIKDGKKLEDFKI